MDKISVIVPVYKTEQYLNRCVQSVTDQTYTTARKCVINGRKKMKESK
mgnify:CR=1 FL=1